MAKDFAVRRDAVMRRTASAAAPVMAASSASPS